MTTSTRHRSRRRLGWGVALMVAAMVAASCSSSGKARLELGDGLSLTEAEFLYGQAPERHPDVTYADDVVLIGGGAKSVRSVTADGLTWTIDAKAEGADELELGKVFFVTGKGVGRIYDLERDGDDLTVTIAPVEITEIIHDGFFEIEDQPIEPDDFIFYDTGDLDWTVTNIAAVPEDGGSPDGVDTGGEGDSGSDDGNGEGDADDAAPGGEGDDTDGPDEEDGGPGPDDDEEASPSLRFAPEVPARGQLVQDTGPTTVDDTGSGEGAERSTPPTVPHPPRPEEMTPERLAEEYPERVERTKAELQPLWAGSRPVDLRGFRVEPIQSKAGVGAQVAYDQGGVHIRATMIVHLGTPSVGFVLDIRGGVVHRAEVRIGGAAGISYSLDMWTSEGFAVANNPHVHLPLPEFGLPLQIAGAPFTLALNTGVQVRTGFSSNDAHLRANGQWRISGGLGFKYQNGAFEMIGPTTTQTARGLLDSISGVGHGASAVMLAFEFQAKAALGWPGLSVGPYVGLMSSISAGQGSDLGMIICKSGSLNMWVQAGIGWRIPKIVATIVNLVLSVFSSEGGIAEAGSIPISTHQVLRKSQFLPNARICQP